MAEPALEAARASGLVPAGQPLLVMLSGGADSVCLLEVALRLEADVSALHVNYGLRAAAEQDEAHCRALCERLGVRADRGAGVAAGRGQRAGPRPRRPLRGGRAGGRRRLRRRAHRLRPGRDRALPAGGVARAARAAGHGAPPRAAGAPAAGRHPRGHARLLPRARPALARGRLQRRSPLRPRAREERAPARPAGGGARRRGRGGRDRPPAARGGRGAGRGGRRGAGRPGRRAGGGAGRAARAAARHGAAGAARAGRRCRWPRARVDEVLRLGEGGGTTALDLGDGLRAVVGVRDAALRPRRRRRPAPTRCRWRCPARPASATGRCARAATARSPWPWTGP